jgi:hypothetical protein
MLDQIHEWVGPVESAAVQQVSSGPLSPNRTSAALLLDVFRCRRDFVVNMPQRVRFMMSLQQIPRRTSTSRRYKSPRQPLGDPTSALQPGSWNWRMISHSPRNSSVALPRLRFGSIEGRRGHLAVSMAW